MKQHTYHTSSHSTVILVLFIVIMAVVFSFYPEKLMPSLTTSWDSLWQFAMIFPAIIILIGLFTVMITPAMIEKNFGRGTGFFGALKALVLGSLMSTGPFYLSFPMARNLIQKGARISAVLIFVSAWNGVGIIAEIVEFHFMGAVFMASRFMLTAVCILALGYIGESLFGTKKQKKKK